MWRNQGPPPPQIGHKNPAFPPGYSAPNCTTPGPRAYPQGSYPGRLYPERQYPAGHYPAPMNPAMIPHRPPRVMIHGAPGLHANPMHHVGNPFHHRGVHPGPFPHSTKGFSRGQHKGHQNRHHHDGFYPMAGGKAAGVGIFEHIVNKSMRKSTNPTNRLAEYAKQMRESDNWSTRATDGRSMFQTKGSDKGLGKSQRSLSSMSSLRCHSVWSADTEVPDLWDLEQDLEQDD